MVRNTEQQLNLGRTLYKILFLFFYTRSHIVQTGLLPYLSARIIGTCHRHHAWLFQIFKIPIKAGGVPQRANPPAAKPETPTWSQKGRRALTPASSPLASLCVLWLTINPTHTPSQNHTKVSVNRH